MCLGYDLKNPSRLWKKPGSHFGTWWRSHDPLLTTWWAQKSKSAAGSLFLVTVVMHCSHGKKHGCCQLQYPIPIGDVEDTSLETKPHLYEPLAPEDASHKQHTRQVTDISGRSRRWLSEYNNNTRPASNHRTLWVILGAELSNACHTHAAASSPPRTLKTCYDLLP